MIIIIIPTFNEFNNIYLEKILTNITNYKNRNLEIIVVDSNSTDGSIKLIKQHPVKIILTHKKNSIFRSLYLPLFFFSKKNFSYPGNKYL